MPSKVRATAVMSLLYSLSLVALSGRPSILGWVKECRAIWWPRACMSRYTVDWLVEGSSSGRPTVKKVALMFSDRTISMTCWARAGSPSSLAQAKLLGRLHPKTRLPDGSLLGMRHPLGGWLTNSTFLTIVLAVV